MDSTSLGAKCWPQTAGIVLNIKKDHGCYTSPFLGSLHFALGSQKDAGRILVKKIAPKKPWLLFAGFWCLELRSCMKTPRSRPEWEAPNTTKLVPVARGDGGSVPWSSGMANFPMDEHVGWGVGIISHSRCKEATAQWEFQDPTDGGTLVPYKAQISGDIPLHRPQK